MTCTESPGEWVTVELVLSQEMADAAADFFTTRESGGVVLEDLSPETVRIRAYFSENRWKAIADDLTVFLNELCTIYPVLPAPELATAPLPYENWAVAWQDSFQPIPIGKTLMVTPPWLHPDPRGRHLLIIEPAEAFGTGTHETTQGCLVLLEEAIVELRKSGDPVSLLDVGCGSGILAVAAVKLGASPVRGVDNDPVAVASAEKNAALNEVQHAVHLACASLIELSGSADIVTANLDARTLLAHRDQLVDLFSRYLIISGVTAEQWEDVLSGLRGAGLELTREIRGAEWRSGLFVHQKSFTTET